MRHFGFITYGLEFYQTGYYHQVIVQNNVKKTFSEKPNDKTFEEIEKFHWDTIAIQQENQNATKKSGYVIFIP